MLEEIFEKITDEIREAAKPLVKKIKIGYRNTGEVKNPSIRIELLNFTPDFSAKNFPSPPPAPSTYGFSFYIIATHNDYLKQLALTEGICNYFEQKPFLQWADKGKEYEMAISAMEVGLEVLNHFWIAQGESHQPVLFYKARVSDI